MFSDGLADGAGTPRAAAERRGNKMTDRDMKKLSRTDLLSILLEQSKKMQQLQERLDRAEAALQDRTIQIDKAGSIAEASLQLSGIFEAAQTACQQYTENISRLSRQQDLLCSQREKESREQAERLLADAAEKAAETERRTKQQCEAMLAEAKAQSAQYWEAVSAKLNAFLDEHAELRRMLSAPLPQSGDEER